MNIITLINRHKSNFDKFYYNILNEYLDRSLLAKAMKYGSMNGGKRIRPFLVYEASKLTKISSKNAFVISSSIESIHSYSLIHDDLPSMDNDDYRRGKASCHKKFNEATAILAGDALHDLAFELLSGNLKNCNSKTILKLINYLTKCTGHNGLAGGQSLDLIYENKKQSKKTILDMYIKKTGKLFEFSFAAPFILCEDSNSKIKFSREFGLLFGVIFQIMDDLLDTSKNFKMLGKTPGKDKKQGKSTLQNIIGKHEVIKHCRSMVSEFVNKNKKHFNENPRLEKILYHNFERLK